MGPGLYSDIGKKARDLLCRDFQTDKSFTITTCTSDGVAITTSGIQKNETFLGNVETKFKSNGFNTVVKVNSDANIYTTITSENLDPGFKSILSFVIPDQKSGKLELQYLHDYAGISTTFGLTASPIVNFAGVFGTKTVAIGADVGFDTATGNFVKYNAGVTYNSDDFTASLTVNDKLETLTATYYHLVSPSPLSSTAVGAELKHNFSSNENTLAFGGQHALDPLTTAKARFDNYGKATALLQHEFRSKSVITFSGEVDTKAIEKSCRVGLSVALKP